MCSGFDKCENFVILFETDKYIEISLCDNKINWSLPLQQPQVFTLKHIIKSDEKVFNQQLAIRLALEKVSKGLRYAHEGAEGLS